MKPRPEPTQEQLQALWNVATQHIDKLEISCTDACGQNDEVYIEAPTFLAKVGEVVGFYDYGDEDGDQ